MRAILTYHSIDDSGSVISLSRETLRAHCHQLIREGVDVVSLDQLLTGSVDKPSVALTFDDGFENFATAAVPELDRVGFTATVFVVTDHVGRFNDWGGRRSAGIPHLSLLSWDTLGSLAERGITIGAHTRRHPSLIGAGVAQLEDEVGGSVDRIERELGFRPATFAYPYGDHDSDARDYVRKTFSAGCTTELRPLGGADDRALLPRIDTYYLRGGSQLAGWGGVSFRARLWLRSLGRRARASISSGRRVVTRQEAIA